MLSGERARSEFLDFTERSNGIQVGSAERDFLRSNARTALSEEYWAAGLRFTIATNYGPILEIARSCFAIAPSGHPASDHIHLRIWVDPSGRSPSRLPKPYFRGLDHLIFIGLDAQSSFLVDLRTGHTLGRLTPDLASDPWLWKAIIFPILLTTNAGTRGRPAVHSGCVAWKGRGVLLAGDSGSGKSTLSLALAQNGFEYVSDDRTILSLCKGRLLAAGSSPCFKLRPNSLAHFPTLRGEHSIALLNQDDAIYLCPAEEMDVTRTHQCEPQMIVWLEQQETRAFSMEKLPWKEIASKCSAGLALETSEAIQAQGHVLNALATSDCFLLKHGGSPQETARLLGEFLTARLEEPLRSGRKISKDFSRPAPHRNDPLRRFTPTPLCSDFRLMRRHIRVESNCAKVMEHTRRALNGYPPATSTLPDFVWRIISDRHNPLAPPWPEMSAFSDRDRRYINLGQKGFIAVDLECREVVAFVSEGLVEDEVGFASIVLASMVYLCAAALGLTAVSSACIASDGKGLLLFGLPHSGKTTSCFIARDQGYEFHADQAVFLEMEKGTPKAWGDFWPAAFHAEASAFLPKLAQFARPFVHCAASYLCAEKHSSPNLVATSVLPVACILLERGTADPPKLIPISKRDLTRLLDWAVPFTDRAGPEESRIAVRQALLKLPAFRLRYDDQPSTPESFFRSLLNTHQVVECLG